MIACDVHRVLHLIYRTLFKSITDWIVLGCRVKSGSCNFNSSLEVTRVLYYLSDCVCPVILTLLFLSLNLRHMCVDVVVMQPQQMIDIRRKYNGFSVLQSIVCYSIWLFL